MPKTFSAQRSAAGVLTHPFRAWCVCAACGEARQRRKGATRQAFHQDQRAADIRARSVYVPRPDAGGMFLTHDRTVYQQDGKGTIRVIGVARETKTFDGKTSGALLVPGRPARGKAARRLEKRRRLEARLATAHTDAREETACPK